MAAASATAGRLAAELAAARRDAFDAAEQALLRVAQERAT
jgi:hypothetical protein